MEITVKYYSSCAASGCALQERTVVLQQSATLRELIEVLGLKSTEAAAIFRNGKSALYEEPLQQGDMVTLLPFVSGG